MKKCILFILVAVLGYGLLMSANPKVKFEKFELKNGLRVIIAENHSSPIAAYAIYYNVGSRNEVKGRTGFAHLFEHMMFQGSENIPRNGHHLWITRGGGSTNGSTSQDRTNYYASVMANQIAVALWAESDRMRSLKITPENFENQRATVKEEKKQSRDNQPYAEAREKLSELMFESFPYRHSVIGSMEDLNAAQLQDVQDFFNTYYAPNNAVLAIVGDINPAEARKLVEKHFGSIPAQTPPPPVVIDEPQREREKKLEMIDKYANIPAVFAGYNVPQKGHPDSYALSFLADILYSGETSRMYKRLVKEKEVAVSVNGRADLMRGAGVFSLNIMVRPDKSPQDAMNLALEEIEKIKNTPVSLAELTKAKTGFKADYINSIEGVLPIAMRLCEFELYNNDASLINTELDKYMAVTPQDIMRVAKKYLISSNLSQITVLPASTPVPDESFRKTAPYNETPIAYQFPRGKEKTLDNGLKMWAGSRNELPKARIQFYFKGGALYEPTDKVGISSILANMMLQGSKKYPGALAQEKLDELGASVNVNAGPDFIVVSINTLKENLVPVMDIAADIIMNPQFDDAVLQQRKRNISSRIVQQYSNPLFLASSMLYRQVFGDHPYSHINAPANAPYVSMLQISPTPESLNLISKADLDAYHKKFFIPNDAMVFVFGDIDQNTIFNQMNQWFLNWKKGEPVAEVKAQLPSFPDKRIIHLIDRPGSVQSYILLGNQLFKRDNPDYFPFLVANKVLGGGRHIGGGFSGRLFLNLREEKGWTYGCYSWIIPFLQSGLFAINAEVRTEITGAALSEIFKEMERIRKGDISAEDMKFSRTFLGNVLPLTQEGANGIIQGEAELKLYNLPAEYWDNYNKNVNQVTLEQAVEAANKYLLFNNNTVVIVGDAAKIEKDLKPLCDELKVYDTKGKLIK